MMEPTSMHDAQLDASGADPPRSHVRREIARERRPASLSIVNGSLMSLMKQWFPQWARFAEDGYDLEDEEQVDLTETIRWLKRPAWLRFFEAHSTPTTAQMGQAKDLNQLQAELGHVMWWWEKDGNRLVPSLPAQQEKLSLPYLRTLYENQPAPNPDGVIYIHAGCEALSPAASDKVNYVHPSYGAGQKAESMFFFADGLALIGRAKTFYDRPKGFVEALSRGHHVGKAWQEYFRIEATEAAMAAPRGDIGRKRAYFWSLLGDWTVRAYPAQPRPPQDDVKQTSTPAVFAEVCRTFTNFDWDHDGKPEIVRVEPIQPGASPANTTTFGQVLVLVEQRLLQHRPGAPDINAALLEYVNTLRAEGWEPLAAAARLDTGPDHKDGAIVLALRRYFQALKRELPRFAGAVLIGSFPEALLVRSCFWKKHGTVELTTPAGPKKFQGVDFWINKPEIVAHRSDLVLADLDGDWESLYVQNETELPYFVAAFPNGIPHECNDGVTTEWELRSVKRQDFFHVNDGGCKTKALKHNQLRIVRQTIHTDAEVSPENRRQPNPIARPTISISRINPRHVAVQPNASVRGNLLDAQGTPQTARFAAESDVPDPEHLWERCEVLERTLLLGFLERRLRHHRTLYNKPTG